ncbi:hypothetical protein RAS1_03760 [Phycisphaerae bacterium RAS1]|nr:hypothetical protein RAS1_03760 [Phycisphaerae bacterium RAS1]
MANGSNDWTVVPDAPPRTSDAASPGGGGGERQGGAAAPPRRVIEVDEPIVVVGRAPAVEFVNDGDGNHQGDQSGSVASFARIGLWDEAFDASGNVLNAEAEADNFIGADSRRFYIHVTDSTASGSVRVRFKTVYPNGRDQDSPPNNTITCTETAAGSGHFISRALMLVTDLKDKFQRTHSGLSGAASRVRMRGDTDFRIRRANVFSSVVAEYQPSRVPFRSSIPVFERSPESRRKVPLQIVILRRTAGGSPVVSASHVWDRDLPMIRAVYARVGVWGYTVVAPGTAAADTVTNGSDSLALMDPPAGVDPADLDGAGEITICNTLAQQADTIRLIYAAVLRSGNRGESFNDASVTAAGGPWGPTAGAAFMNVSIRSRGPYSAVHETIHVLWDKPASANGGHYIQLASPGRRFEPQNLMRNGTSEAKSVSATKRIWVEADADGAAQFSTIRASHYTRNW